MLKMRLPLDANNHAVHRAMGLPSLQDAQVLVSATKFIDIFDLSSAVHLGRAFTGIAVSNPSPSTTVEVAFGASFAATKQIVVGAQQFLVFDDMLFGPETQDESTGVTTVKVRAKLGTLQGVQSTGTIGYAAANPTDGMSVVINGVVYEFSGDKSAAVANVKVDIAATADLTYTNLVSVVNATEQAVTASVNTGTDVFTLTSVGGGTASLITIADGAVPTGATFSGATLTGWSGGVTPIFHIW